MKSTPRASRPLAQVGDGGRTMVIQEPVLPENGP